MQIQLHVPWLMCLMVITTATVSSQNKIPQRTNTPWIRQVSLGKTSQADDAAAAPQSKRGMGFAYKKQDRQTMSMSFTFDLLNNCLKKANVVLYRDKISNQQPLFVQACKAIWRSFLHSNIMPHFVLRHQPGKQIRNVAETPNPIMLGKSLSPFTIMRPMYPYSRQSRIMDQKRSAESSNLSPNKHQSLDMGKSSIMGFSNDVNDISPSKTKVSQENNQPMSIPQTLDDKPDSSKKDTESKPPAHSRQKRSPWAGSESRYSSILNILRTRLHRGAYKRTSHKYQPNPKPKHSHHHRGRRSLTYLDLPDNKNLWAKFLQQRPVGEHERSNRAQSLFRPSDLHPFSGGIGDYAAKMALGTYAKLLQSEFQEQRKLFDGPGKTTRNVRPFVG